MNKDTRTRDSFLFEDFDIKALSEKFPEQKIGVNISRIYIQIAKYNQNPNREKEIKILKNALVHSSNKYNFDSRYTIMKLQDVVVCFGKNLKKIPKSTFVNTHPLGLDD